MSSNETFTVTSAQIERALREYVAELDYDTHKNLECNEETGEDTYADEVGYFINALTRPAD